MEVNGIAHIQLTVRDLERSIEFYEPFHQGRVGLHHFCFRARSRADVDEIYEFAKGLGAVIVHPPQEDGFAPGYYSVLFEDPDGIRIEANYVPGKGNLDPSVRLPIADTLGS